ncbi:MAG: hypothetical protein P8I46_01300, partial [Pseudomonadales bacterium]|nr:hypothetical protein [Pseudomonadales bacterium]
FGDWRIQMLSSYLRPQILLFSMCSATWALAFSSVLTALGKSWHRYQHLNRKSRRSWCFSFIEGYF